MKRNWEVIRDILTDIENDNLEDRINSLQDEEQELYLRHLELLVDSGYVIGADIEFYHAGYRLNLNCPRLSMEGYDFKDILQDKRLWNKIQQMAKDNFVKLSWVFIKEAIPFVIKEIVK